MLNRPTPNENYLKIILTDVWLTIEYRRHRHRFTLRNRFFIQKNKSLLRPTNTSDIALCISRKHNPTEIEGVCPLDERLLWTSFCFDRHESGWINGSPIQRMATRVPNHPEAHPTPTPPFTGSSGLIRRRDPPLNTWQWHLAPFHCSD